MRKKRRERDSRAQWKRIKKTKVLTLELPALELPS